MNNDKQLLLDWIESDRDKLIQFFSGFIKAKSPNPPGDTRLAASFAAQRLDEAGLNYELVEAQPGMPNVIASFSGEAGDGKHLVLNGHMDVFPAEEKTPSGRDSFSGDVEYGDQGSDAQGNGNGKVYGRGACDMKAGTTASLMTYIYLYRMRDRLKGRLSLTMVSDEETLGPWGSQYLLENHPDAPGDCCLNGEPSSAHTILFAERGFLWLEFTVSTEGAHGSFGHQASKNAVLVATQLMADLDGLVALPAQVPADIATEVAESTALFGQFVGEEAAKTLGQVKVGVGRIEGGSKVNMMPSDCTLEIDIRIPLGLTKDVILTEIDRILTKYPQVSVREINSCDPTWCDPNNEMVGFIRSNAKQLSGAEPALMVSTGATDCRLWRERGVPAFCYGPSPVTMATVDEWVEIDDFLHVVRSHVLSAYDYLTQS